MNRAPARRKLLAAKHEPISLEAVQLLEKGDLHENIACCTECTSVTNMIAKMKVDQVLTRARLIAARAS
jgi:hypothetical protein